MSSSASWTHERVATLTRLWQDGLSAAQIAAALGGITRNAVIGKVHRLGLSGRAKSARPGVRRAAAPKRRAPAVPPPPRRLVLRAVACGPESPGTATVETLAAHACRWPIGDPLAADFTLCGRTAARGAYCEAHAQRAYRPISRKPPADHLLKLAGLA